MNANGSRSCVASTGVRSGRASRATGFRSSSGLASSDIEHVVLLRRRLGILRQWRRAQRLLQFRIERRAVGRRAVTAVFMPLTDEFDVAGSSFAGAVLGRLQRGST